VAEGQPLVIRRQPSFNMRTVHRTVLAVVLALLDLAKTPISGAR
jgi:hypothetical protein